MRFLIVYVVTLLFLMAAGPSVAEAQISREDARNAAIASVIAGSPTETTLLAYLYRTTEVDSVLQVGETVISKDADDWVNFTAMVPTYFIFVDDYPEDSWLHEVRYVFVDAVTGAVTSMYAEGPPLINGTDDAYAVVQERFESPDIFFGDPTDHMSLESPKPGLTSASSNPVILSAASNPDTCALLFRGTVNADEAAIDTALATDMRLMRQLFKDLGLPESSIKEVTVTSATAFAESVEVLAAGKRKVWIYYTGHGHRRGGGGPYFASGTTQAERVGDWKDIACAVETADPDEACIIVDCCFSGRAADDFQSKDINGVFVAACHPDQKAKTKVWGRKNPDGTTTVTRGWSAYTKALVDCFGDPAADLHSPPNGVSLDEAHTWAREEPNVAERDPLDTVHLYRPVTMRYLDRMVLPASLVDPFLYKPHNLSVDPVTGEILSTHRPQFPGLDPVVVSTDPATQASNSVCPPVAPGTEGFAPYIIDPVNPFASLLNGKVVLFDGTCNVTQCIPSGPGREAVGVNFFAPDLGAPVKPMVVECDSISPSEIRYEFRYIDTDLVVPSYDPNYRVPLVEHDLADGKVTRIRGFDHLDDPAIPTREFFIPRLSVVVVPDSSGKLGIRFYRWRDAGGEKSAHYDLPFILPDPAVPTTLNPQGVVLDPNINNWQPKASGVIGVAQASHAFVVYVLTDTPGPTGEFEILVYGIEGLGGSALAAPEEPRAASPVLLSQNAPNPIRSSTRIGLSLDANASYSSLRVFDISGRLVTTLHRGSLAAGRHSFVWDSRDENGKQVSAGVYFYRLELDTEEGAKAETRRMVVLP